MKDLKTYISAALVLILAMFCCPFSLGAAITYTHIMSESDLNIYEVTAPDGTVFSRISGTDMFGGGEVGHPEIPYKVIRFLVPDNAYDFTVAMEDSSDTEMLMLDNPIFPNQQAISINDYCDDLFTYCDEDAYDSFSSTFNVQVLEESRLEGRYHIVAVGLWPLAYSGISDKIELCKSMRIRLDFKENVMFKKKSTAAQSESFVNISDIVVNADMMDSSIAKASDFSGIGQISQVNLPRYYIISERSLIPALEDLATWKTQKGYRVITKAVEDIYADSNYKVGTNGIVDEAASLRKYLQDEYATYGTFFCFLVGDHRTRVPIRKVYDNNPYFDSESYNSDKYIPTDIYFSNLSERGWELFKDGSGFYVEKSENVLFDPYIYVGRLLCNTPQQIKNYTSKLILYESNPGRGESDYLVKSSMFVQINTNLSYTVTCGKLSNIFENFESFLDSKISNSAAVCSPTGEFMREKINECGYISLSGHGEPSTLACSGRRYFNEWEYIKALEWYKHDLIPSNSQTNIEHTCYNNSLDLLDNFDRPSVIYTVACTTMPFDTYISEDLTFDIPHTVASSYTVGGLYGGVAYLGNTRSGWSDTSPVLERQFLDCMIEYPKLGVAEAMSRFKYMGDRYIKNAHNLIGDPEFELWRSRPSSLNVYFSWNQSNISVWGSDAVGSNVVINNGEGGIRLYSVNASKSPITYLDGGKMEAVGVYKTGFLPIAKLDCYYDDLQNCNKKFVVREALIGCPESSSVVIGQKANIDVRAVDCISAGSGLNILSGGKLNLRCDKQISLEGSEVATGGQISIQGEKVTLSKGFSVKAGGTLSITTN